ncbi:MAG: DNA mismatch repair endonuclease MutL, partial [Clostridia bacterium]
MPSIQKLSPELIGQIAAGEVVERPASAVKELVENAIDAGATNVTVELREGGVSYLRVSDNGRGIPAEQLRMAFERHATSKLRRADDLFNIHTLGFRGEALASIAAVARVSCTTRTADAAFGTRATVGAAEFTDIRQAASPVGTTIVVEDLFFNTPVRLKFLKKPAMEAAMVADYMLRLILSKPEISFRFVSQGKTVYHSLGDGKAESALFSLYGKDALRQMRRVDGHMNGVLVSGFVGVGELARGNRQQQSFFVNGRYFKSALLSKALENGCEGRVMIGRFPMCALYLQIDYQQVDVNVHPNKLEVRFQNEAGVAQAVQTMVSDALHAENLGAALSAGDVQKKPSPPQPEKTEGFVVVSLGNEEETAPVQAPTPAQEPTPVQAPTSLTPPAPVCQAAPPPIQPAQVRKPVVLPPVQAPLRMNETVMPRRNAEVLLQRYAEGQSAAAAPVPQPAVVSMVQPVATPTPCVQPEEEQTTLLANMAGEQAPLRLVGIVFDTYWIFEAGEKLLLVDQHAAHERILYD